MATLAKYNSFLKYQFDGTAVIDFNTDTIKVALVTSAYTPSATTHDYFNDITSEVTGTNYTAGGATLASLTLTESGGTVTFDAADVTWSYNATGFSNARYAIVYKSTGTAATSPLIGYVDFGADKGNTSSDLRIQWGASGVFTVA
jgi:hypothetical protein